MLEMKTAWERCGVALACDRQDARICSYECTFCSACAESIQGPCPNGGGILCVRPTRMRKEVRGGAPPERGATPEPAPSPFPTAEAYAAERALFDDLVVVELWDRQSQVGARYRNEVLANVNGECLRLAVFEEAHRWHCRPGSDALFLVVDGVLEIDLEDRTVRLAPWQMIRIPAGTVHRTRAVGRTANVTFEQAGARTAFLDAPAARRWSRPGFRLRAAPECSDCRRHRPRRHDELRT